MFHKRNPMFKIAFHLEVYILQYGLYQPNFRNCNFGSLQIQTMRYVGENGAYAHIFADRTSP